MNILKKILLPCLLLISNLAHANSPKDVLSITVVPPTPSKLTLLDYTHDVYLDGVIDENAPQRLYEAVEKIPVGVPIEFFLNSPGGNLYAGLMMGRIIRSVRGVTGIGKNPGLADYQAALEYSKPGVCASACTFVFLGGSYRFYKEGSVFGVHQFYAGEDSKIKDPLSSGQITTAHLAAYLKEMGIDSDLLSYMVQADKNNLKELSKSEMEKLNVVNNGRAESKWTIEVLRGYKDGYYLQGIQEVSNGLGKALFMCSAHSEILLSASYIPEQKDRVEIQKIIKEKWPVSLMLSKHGEMDLSSISDVKYSVFEGDGLMTTQTLTNEQARRIVESQFFQYVIQPSRGSELYVGFSIDMNEEDFRKLEAFFYNCIGKDTVSLGTNRTESRTAPDDVYVGGSNNKIIDDAVNRIAGNSAPTLKTCMINKLEIFSRRLLAQDKYFSDIEYQEIIEQAASSTARSCQKEEDAFYKGPSFDCTKELNITEQAICSNPKLSIIDVMFDNAVRAAKAMSTKNIQDQITKELRSWIQRRNACGSNISCIENIYVEQIQRVLSY